MTEAGNPVVAHLEAAIEAAGAANMSASELLGLLFFYAHDVAQQARESAVTAVDDGPS